MATLYEIDQKILSCVDMETGEIIDLEQLEALQMERADKIQNVALYIKNLDADAAAYEAEEKAFAARKKAATNRAASLRAYLTQALQGEKFTTAKCAVSFRTSEAVEVTDESKIPSEYLAEKVTYTPNKTAIKAQFKAGFPVDGCQLVSRLNVQVR